MHGESMSFLDEKYGANDFLSTPRLGLAPVEIASYIDNGIGYGREDEAILSCNNGIGNP